MKHSENTLGSLVTSDDKTSDCGISNDVVEETEIADYTVVKEESDVEEEVTESYEEIEFLELNGQTDIGIQIVADDKCEDDEFIDEIIEECSLDDNEIITDVDHTIDVTTRNVLKVCVHLLIYFHKRKVV